MPTAFDPARADSITLDLERLVGVDNQDADTIAGDNYIVYRAVKTRDALRNCIEMLNSAGVVALVPVAASAAYLETVGAQLSAFASERATTLDARALPSGILALPTSGTTGTPKLVALPAHGISKFLAWGADYFGFGRQTTSLSLSPWNFDVALLDTWAVLSARGTVVAVEPERLLDVEHLQELLENHQPTFLQVVPSTLAALISAVGDRVYNSVSDLVLTGGVAPQSQRSAASRAFPHARFHNVYGATEVNDCLVCTLTPEAFGNLAVLPLGQPISDCELYIQVEGEIGPLSLDRGGQTGELFTRTPWMALGYIAENRLLPLTRHEDSLYPMKDVVHCEDGELTYVGRRDRMVKIRGQRVNLEEIENAARKTGLVVSAHAWISHQGENDALHLAYVPVKDSTAKTAFNLRIAMSSHLPHFSMPNRLHGFKEAFPLNGNGKPDVQRIEQQARLGDNHATA